MASGPLTDLKILITGDFCDPPIQQGLSGAAEYFQIGAKRTGAQVEYHDTSRITYQRNKDPQVFEAELALLDETLDRFKPDFVTAFGNYPPFSRLILSEETWGMLKQKHGFKLCIFVTDAIQIMVSFSEYWRRTADVIMTMAADTTYTHSIQVTNQHLDWVGIATHNRPPPIWHQKNGVAMIGREKRYRQLAYRTLADLPIERRVFLHDLSESSVIDQASVKQEDFFSAYENAWYSYDLSRTQSVRIVTGRMTEAMLSGCITMESALKPDITRYFVPWKHYIPIHTYGGLRQIILFFEKYPEVRQAFAERSRAFYLEHYHGEMLWYALLDHVGLLPKNT